MSDTDETNQNNKRWVYYLWLFQLVVPLPILAYASFRLVNGSPAGPQLLAATYVSVLWACGTFVIPLSRRGRKWLIFRRKHLLACFAAFAFAICLGDLCLTLTGVIPTVAAVRARSAEFRAAVSTVHRLVPKTIAHAEGPPVTINSRGFRGPEVAIPKPATMTRIVFLGGSHVADFDRGGRNDWPTLTGKLLAERKHNVDVINAGVPGHRTTDSLGKLLTDLWLLEPDMIVVCHAWNDIKYFSRLNVTLPYRDIVTPPKDDWRIEPTGIDWMMCCSALYRMERTRLISILIDEEGEGRLDPTGTVGRFGIRQFQLNLEAICDVANSLGLRVVLCKQARLATYKSGESDKERIAYHMVGIPHDELVRAFAECDRVTTEVARRKGCHIADLSSRLTGRAELFRDHVHFTSKGSQEAAVVMADELDAILKSLPKGEL